MEKFKVHTYFYQVLYIKVRNLGFYPQDTLSSTPDSSRLIESFISALVAPMCTSRTSDQSGPMAGVLVSQKREQNWMKEKACVVGGTG